MWRDGLKGGCLWVALTLVVSAQAQAPAPAEMAYNTVLAVVGDRAVTRQDLVRLLRNDKPPEEQIRAALKVTMDNLVLIKHRQGLPTYFEAPGLVDGLLRSEIRDRYKGDQSELARDLQAMGTTLADHRRRLVEGWILRVVDYELRETVSVSPRQVRDYYMEHFARDAGQRNDVVELSLIRVRRDATKPVEQVAGLEKLVRAVDSPEAFQKLVESQGLPGDGLQGLLPMDYRVAALGTGRAIDEIPENDRRLLLVKAHKEMAAGKAETESPPGSAFHYLIFVGRKLEGYVVSLESRRLEIRTHLAEEAYREQKRLLLEKARKAVFVANYHELDRELKGRPTPPAVPAPKPANP